MNWKTTLFLLLLAGAGVAGYLLRDELPDWINPAVKEHAERGETQSLLAEKLMADRIRQIEIRKGKEAIVTLSRNPQGKWAMPGNWPTRDEHIRELVGHLTHLSSRFRAIRMSKETDLKEYGLAEPDLTVKLTGEDSITLLLGRGEPTGEGNTFYRPTYLKIEGKDEILRLEPDVLAKLDKSQRHYRRHRLFPQRETVEKGDGSREVVERLKAQKLEVVGPKQEGKQTSFTLVYDEAWNEWTLSEPFKDRANPEASSTILEAIPNLWVRGFPSDEELKDQDTGLQNPDRIIRVTTEGGTTELMIGKVQRTEQRARQERDPRTGRPIPIPYRIEHRYAKLKDNDQVFLLTFEEADLSNLFTNAADLRDPKLARFEGENVESVTITRAGKKPINLSKKDDQWMVGDKQADRAKVEEILSGLTDPTLSGEDILKEGDPGYEKIETPSVTIEVAVKEKLKDGTSKTRTRTFLVGKHLEDDKKLLVKLKDWPRLNRVGDDLLEPAQRSALAYRDTLLDFDRDKVAKVEIRQMDKNLHLTKADEKWTVTEPIKLEVSGNKVSQLTDQLKTFDPVEMVTDVPTPEDLDKVYGLAKPELSVAIESGGKTHKLLLGNKAPEDKGYYAKLESEPDVFVIDKEIRGQLTKDALAYLSEELWFVPREEVASVRAEKMGAKPYLLKSEEDEWKLTEPFEADDLKAEAVNDLVDALGSPRCQRYVTHQADKPEEHGFDKPYLKLTLQSSEKDAKPRELIIGRKTEDGKGRFAKVGGQSPVCVLEETLLKSLDQTALTLLDPVLLSLEEGGYLSSVVTKGGDKGFTLTRAKLDDDWKVEGAPGSPFPADDDATTFLTSQVFRLVADRYEDFGKEVDWAKYGLDQPSATVELKVVKNDAEGQPSETKTHVIRLGKEVESEKGKRYARLDDGLGLAVLTEDQAQALDRNYLDYVSHELWSLGAETIKSIRRTGGSPVTLTKADDEWKLTAPAEHEADSGMMRNLVADLSRLRGEKVVDFPKPDLKKYGLDKPSATFVLEAGEEKHTLLLGENRHAMVEGGKKVVVLPKTITDSLLAEPLRFRDKTIAPVEGIDTIGIESGKRKLTFVKKDDAWSLTEPVEASADDARLTRLLDSVMTLRADELVAEKPENLAMYGLDKPTARWTLMNGDKAALDLLVGKKEAMGQRAYAKLAEGDVVFLLSSDLTAQLAEEYRTLSVWTKPLDAVAVEQVTLTRGETTLSVEKRNNLWVIGGIPADQDAVNELLAALSGLKLEHYASDQSEQLKLYGLDPARLKIELKTPSGMRSLLLGGNVGESKSIYGHNPAKEMPGVFVLSEKDAEKLMRDLEVYRPKP